MRASFGCNVQRTTSNETFGELCCDGAAIRGSFDCVPAFLTAVAGEFK